MSRDADVSVVLATYRRPDMLIATLEGLCSIDASGLSWEIVVVDNDAGPDVPRIVDEFSHRIPIVAIAEDAPGKNHALLAGLQHATGRLLAFTDDDVLFERSWLQEIHNGAARHPEASFFGGRVLPLFPDGRNELTGLIDSDHWFIRSAYAIADWNIEEGPIDPTRVWGPNMAVRRAVFDAGLSFNPKVGPSGDNYVMGSETEFLLRVHAAGYHGVYLPKAIVHHRIRAEQMTRRWLRGRAFRMGRGHAVRSGANSVKLFGAPRYLFRRYAELQFRRLLSFTRSASHRLHDELELELVKGEILQHWEHSHRGNCN